MRKCMSRVKELVGWGIREVDAEIGGGNVF